MDPETDDRPGLGISACLLGDQVRFDGGHKRDAFLTDILSPHVRWVRVCPEVEVGMGTPRETLRLERREDGAIRMVTTRTDIDHTDAMSAWARKRLIELEQQDLSGYVLKKDSPSCGMEGVKVFGRPGPPRRNGRGIFAEALLQRFPNLPVEEEGSLSDPRLRENFIERVFAYQRLQRFFAGRWTVDGLVRFHTSHKMSLLSHSTDGYRELGRLVASAATVPRAALRSRYESRFMQTLTVIVRGLALGELSWGNARKTFFKEAVIGLGHGLVLGLIAAGVVWVATREPMIGLLLAMAMVCNMFVATVAGTLVPLGLKAMRVDPALASSVFITTFTDVVGFASFLGFATIFLRYLTSV